MKDNILLLTLQIIDCLTLIRLPAIFFSCMKIRGMKCYYHYRVLTTCALFITWVALFIFYAAESVSGRINSLFVIMFGIMGGTFLVVDYQVNKVLLRIVIKQIRREQIHLSKIKGRMLKQKEHKGPVRIDTPPPYARSDARSVGSRSNRWGVG